MTRTLIETLRRTMEHATYPGDWALYTSNSVRRIGLKSRYHEIVYACRQSSDGHLDIHGTRDLEYAVAAANAAPALLDELDRLRDALQLQRRCLESTHGAACLLAELAGRPAPPPLPDPFSIELPHPTDGHKNEAAE